MINIKSIVRETSFLRFKDLKVGDTFIIGEYSSDGHPVYLVCGQAPPDNRWEIGPVLPICVVSLSSACIVDITPECPVSKVDVEMVVLPVQPNPTEANEKDKTSTDKPDKKSVESVVESAVEQVQVHVDNFVDAAIRGFRHVAEDARKAIDKAIADQRKPKRKQQ